MFLSLLTCIVQRTVNCLAEFFKPPEEVYAVQSVLLLSTAIAYAVAE